MQAGCGKVRSATHRWNGSFYGPGFAADEPLEELGEHLALPPFLLSAQQGLEPGDIAAGLTLTGRFLQDFVFAALNRPLPPARARLIERLGEAGRLDELAIR